MAPRLHLARALALAVALSPLAACGSFDGIGEKVLLGGTKPEPMDPKIYAATPVCPSIEIRDGTEFLPIFEAGKQGDLANIRFQANVQRVARDCEEDPTGGIRVKIGAAGRVLSGPKGATGSVTIPVRVAAVVGERVIYSKLVPTTVDVMPPDNSALWSIVDDGFLVSVADSHEATIYIGLDGQASAKAPKPAKGKRGPTKG